MESNNISAVKSATNGIKGLTEEGTNYPYTDVRFKPLIIPGESPPLINTIKEATYSALPQRYAFPIPLWRKQVTLNV